MKSQVKRLLTATAVVVLIAPQITFAAWWNPMSWHWNIFSYLFSTHATVVVPVTTSTISTHSQLTTATTSTTPSLPKEPSATSTTQPKTTVSADKKIGNEKPSALLVPPTVQTPTFVQPGTPCNGTYYSNCPAGQNFVCPTTGSAYCSLPKVLTKPTEKVASTTTQEASLLPTSSVVDTSTTASSSLPTKPKIGLTFNASPIQASFDGSTELTWSAPGADSCVLDSPPDLLAPQGSKQMEGLTKKTSYTITCSAGTYSTSSSLTVDVMPFTCPAGSQNKPVGSYCCVGPGIDSCGF